MPQALIRAATTTLPDRRLWGTTDKYSVKGQVVNGMFVIGILDFGTEGIFEYMTSDTQLDPANRTRRAVYQFPTAPSQYEVVEPAATQIIPTQDGGKFIESHGNIFKDIRIGGTVGFRPNVPSTELIPGAKSVGVNTSPPSFITDALFTDERGLNVKEATGFDDIVFLRNIFRYYFDLKQRDGVAQRIAMIWTYVKEAETYIVEPVSFTVTRDAGNPLSWAYNIQLRTISMLDVVFEVVEDPMDVFTLFNKGMQALDQIGRDLNRALNSFANLIKYVISVPFNIAETVLGIGINVLNGIASIRSSFDFAKGLPESRVKAWKAAATEAFRLATGAGPAPYSGGSGIRSATFALSDPSDVHRGPQGEMKWILRKMISMAETLLSLDFLWAKSKNLEVADRSAAYDNAYGESPITFGSPLNTANISIPESAREEKIIAGETIRSLAKRLSGNEAYWKQYVICNNLRAPYIAPVASPGVLGYGDRILVPEDPKTPSERLKTSRQLLEDARHQALTEAQKSYGRDVKLLDVGAGGGSVADLSVNKQGDLELIDSEENVIQALLIKMSTEQGGLAVHPDFGNKFAAGIGVKTPRLDKLHEFSLNMQRTIRQDPRIEQIESVRTYVDSDKLYFSAVVKLALSNSKLPITFSVRR